MESRKLSIAICDSDKTANIILEEMLKQADGYMDISIMVDPFYSAEGLKQCLLEGVRYDAIFLATELFDGNGAAIGDMIRFCLHDSETQIIYVSHHNQVILHLLQTRPIGFLRKPISRKEVQKVLQHLLRWLQWNNRLFSYRIDREIYQVEYDKILYFRSEKHKVYLVTRKSEVPFYGKLSDVERHTPNYFLFIHKSFLVNINHVKQYGYYYVILDNDARLTVSRAYQKELKRKLQIQL